MSTRIAMWCGPRTISTAMMRAWENRPDTTVSDEPLYACYLHRTGLEHPGRAEVLASQSTDYGAVVDHLTGPAPEGQSIWYQKHMAHHLLPEMDRSWLSGLQHCFLIREPAAVIASYAKARPEVTLADIGIGQQAELLDWLEEQQGATPIVIDSRDVLEDPSGVLRALCEALGVDWTEEMLTWPPGPRSTDGAWAPHWYASVERSTGFEPYEHREAQVPARLAAVADAAAEPYRRLYAQRLKL